MSADERLKGRGRAIWTAARRVALPLVPLLLGVTATSLLANSGTVQLPRIGAPGSHSSLPPAQTVVVQAGSTRPHGARHRTAPKTSKRGVRIAASAATQHPTAARTRPKPTGSVPKSRSGGHGRHSPPSSTGGTPSGGGGSPPPTTTPTTPTPPPTTTPTPPTTTTTEPSAPPPASVSTTDEQTCSSNAIFPPGRAIGRRSHTPPGRAVGHGNHAAPGQACKRPAARQAPEAPPAHGDDDASHGNGGGDSAAGVPPGHAYGHADGSQGQGNGHGQGHGQAHGHGNGH